MARINIDLPDELEQKFRVVVGRAYGAKKGVVRFALSDAIQDWIAKITKVPREPVATPAKKPIT